MRDESIIRLRRACGARVNVLVLRFSNKHEAPAKNTLAERRVSG